MTTQQRLPLLYELELDELTAWLKERRQPAYRARQIFAWAYQRSAGSFADMTDLPRDLRAQLEAAFRCGPLAPRAVSQSEETSKLLLELADGQTVECVRISMDGSYTACVSSQVGCAVKCAFCATGQLKLQRSLTAGEIIQQVVTINSLGERVRNVVFMGMGEPFHNYDETLRACRLLNDPDGFGLAARAISVSTAGVVPGIERFAGEKLQLNLAVSLHAGTDALRDDLVPLNRRYPLDALFAACERYVTRTRRKLLFEYVVLAGVNDTAEQVDALAGRLRRRLYHLNLIAYNETGGEFVRPEAGEIEAFRRRLEAAGVSCTVRRSPGGEIEAACGQLALRHDAA